MPHVRESVTIDRPVEEVFRYTMDPENQTTIMSNLESFEADGPMEKGTRATGVTRVAGRRVEWTSEITEFQPNRRVEIRSLEAPMGFHITWTYESAGDGCLVTFDQEVDGIGSFFGKLADPIVTKMYSRDMRGNLDNLKVLLEEV